MTYHYWFYIVIALSNMAMAWSLFCLSRSQRALINAVRLMSEKPTGEDIPDYFYRHGFVGSGRR